MTAPHTRAKRAAAGTLALAVCFTGGLVAATSATAAAGFTFDTRLSGATRLDTAVAASRTAFKSGATTVVLVNEGRFADGLTASYVAGNAGAPILYVSADGIPDQTSDEIKRLDATKVIIVGGEAVVSRGVQTSLDSSVGDVVRISGKDRFETAARAATSGSNDVSTVFITNGDATADALAAGPIAYRSHHPIVLVERDSVPASAQAALDRLKEKSRIVVGGKAVVSDAGYAAADATSRLSGSTRQGTAVELAKYAIANEAGFDSGNVALVGSSERNAADALIAAAVAGKAGTPILFTEGDRLGAGTAAYLQSIAGGLDGTGYVFGGTAAVPESVAGEATAAAGGAVVPPKPPSTEPPSTEPPGAPPPGAPPPSAPPPSAAQGIAVSPADAAVNEVSTTTGDDINRGSRTYTATRLDDAKTYVIGLLPTDTVTVTADGTVTYQDADRNNQADGLLAPTATGTAIIEVVNGSSIGLSQVAGVSPLNGAIAFTVDSTEFADVVPVVFEDSTTNRQLNLKKPPASNRDAKVADERSAVGGAITYLPGEASDGSFSITVRYVNRDEQYFIGTDSTTSGNTNSGTTRRYDFSAGDVFEYNSKKITATSFLAALSEGDIIGDGGGEYSGNFQSTFRISTDQISVPTDLSVLLGDYDADPATTDADQARLSWKAPSPANGLIGSYQVQVKEADEDDDGNDGSGDVVVNPTLVGSTNPRFDTPALGNGDYVWQVRTTSVAGQNSAWSDLSSFTVQVGDRDEVAPTVTDVSFVKGGGGSALEMQAGDKIRFVFSESMDRALAAGGGKIRFTDPEGQIFDLGLDMASATNTSGVLSDNESANDASNSNAIDDDVLTVTLGSGQLPVQVGGTTTGAGSATAGAQVPATINKLNAAFSDTSGNQVDLAESLDTTIDITF